MATQSIAVKHWARIIKKWPIDKVRPETVSFQTVMQRRVDKRLNPSLNTAATSVKGNAALVSADPIKFDEKSDMKQVNTLYSLLEDRYAKQYPLPEHLRHPRTSPNHYDDLIAEIDEAPSRSWFAQLSKRFRGSLRMK